MGTDGYMADEDAAPRLGPAGPCGQAGRDTRGEGGPHDPDRQAGPGWAASAWQASPGLHQPPGRQAQGRGPAKGGGQAGRAWASWQRPRPWADLFSECYRNSWCTGAAHTAGPCVCTCGHRGRHRGLLCPRQGAGEPRGGLWGEGLGRQEVAQPTPLTCLPQPVSWPWGWGAPSAGHSPHVQPFLYLRSRKKPRFLSSALLDPRAGPPPSEGLPSPAGWRLQGTLGARAGRGGAPAEPGRAGLLRAQQGRGVGGQPCLYFRPS